jgi:hypothetical protein
MEYKIDIIELEDFHKLVDDVIEGIEKGTVVANPLKREFTDLGDVVVAETATEKGEEVREETPFDIAIKFKLQDLPELGGKLIPRKTVILYHLDTLDVIEVFIDAAKASTSYNIHQTTVRTRCSKGYVDPTGVVWTYYYEGLIPANVSSDVERKSYITDL